MYDVSCCLALRALPTARDAREEEEDEGGDAERIDLDLRSVVAEGESEAAAARLLRYTPACRSDEDSWLASTATRPRADIGREREARCNVA